MLLFSRCHKNPESERKYWSKYELKLEGKKGQRGVVKMIGLEK
jgi:hypothetical protein